MSSSSPPPRKFILRSSDGKSYELEGKAALESRMIRDMIEDECLDDVIPVPSPGYILDKVVVFCKKQAERDIIPVPSPNPWRRVPSPLERELVAWELDFVKVDRATLSHLCGAANYLNIDRLLDAICQSLSDKIHGKTPEEIVSRGMQNDSTYKVKKIIAALNDSQVPPPDVVEVVVCPPPLSEWLVQSSLRGDFQIATEIHGRNYGKTYVWEHSAEVMVKKGIPWVILGHANKRQFLHDSNEIVGDKVAYVKRHGLKVIACVGETIRQREAGRTMDVVTAQIKAIAERVSVSDWEDMILAYNHLGPVATSSQAQEIHAEIRKWLHANVSPEVASTTRIIYGSSVSNADWEELAIQPDIDGFLVDGPPLKEFIDVIKLAEKVE